MLNGAAPGAGALPVYIKPASTSVIQNTLAAVTPSTTVTVVTYTNTTGAVVYMDGWSSVGQYEADWRLYVNTVMQSEIRDAVAGPTAKEAFNPPIVLNPGDIVDVKMAHYGGATGEFSGTIYLHTQ